jgi:hypothetical protein
MLEMATHHHFFASSQARKNARLGTFSSGSRVQRENDMRFDENTSQKLQYYVYSLIDPRDKKPFYIGKGKDNRVFDHLECALESPTASDKYEKIWEIVNSGLSVTHVIIKHGLTEKTAFQVESSLIDYSIYFGHKLTNEVLGHNSIENGLMSSDEVVRKYNAPKLEKIDSNCVLININKTYKRGSGMNGIYQATKESWVIDKNKTPTIKYALSEYRGLVVAVFEISEWYPVNTTDKHGNPKVRWGFNGVVAPIQIRQEYINMSVAHVKVQGASNPIRYTLETLNKSKHLAIP